VVTDLGHRIQYGNRSARELFNLSLELLGQQSLQDYIEDGYKILSHIHQQLIHGKPVSGYRVTIKPNSEKSFDAHLNADLLFGKAGQSEGLIINLTNPLVNDEIFSRLVRKEKLSTIVHLANSLSHEIRNPINIMYGRLQLLQKEVKDSNFQNAFTSIHRQIERILSITELLEKFNFSREDSIPEKCNISKIFETILLEKESHFIEKKIKIDCNLQSDEFI
jgi:nitrogen-specific signal transduction histidine kinase